MTQATVVLPKAVPKYPAECPPPTLRQFLIRQREDADWGSSPNGARKFDSTTPVLAPRLAPVRQHSPPKFVPLNAGWGKGRGGGGPGQMGRSTPITHPATVQNPLRQPAQVKQTGWIPPPLPPPQIVPMQSPAHPMVPIFGLAPLAKGALPRAEPAQQMQVEASTADGDSEPVNRRLTEKRKQIHSVWLKVGNKRTRATYR